MKGFPKSVRVVEVSARDGLQNEKQALPTAVKIELIDRLGESGLSTIEVSSFVSPRWVPQLADAAEVMAGINKKPAVRYPVLVPNEKGMQRAIAAGASEVAVFAAASETFSKKNSNASISESLQRIEAVMSLAKENGMPVRGYLSCVLGCPYEGDIGAAVVAELAERLAAMGCYEISLGDTIGAGTPFGAQKMLTTVAEKVPMDELAIHFHDTRGQALANIYACLELGVSVIDASVAGLGGCPYAKGASGNVASEDLVYLLHGMAIETGIDLDALVDTGLYICRRLDRIPGSRLGQIAWRKQDFPQEKICKSAKQKQ
ncbi:MAG: hydroxymethylglutaryl-CoA lyase [Gammaproteobacteria bacterium]|nr:hydroxymethylglutaryl-CoA lyase [Gammaproteobacteria bacterium]